MLHQPNPEAAPDLSAGIQAIRHMHIRAMAESGLTAADEMLYPENRSYLDDVLSCEAVGARSVEKPAASSHGRLKSYLNAGLNAKIALSPARTGCFLLRSLLQCKE